MENTDSRLFIKVNPCWTGFISGWVDEIHLCCTSWEVNYNHNYRGLKINMVDILEVNCLEIKSFREVSNF